MTMASRDPGLGYGVSCECMTPKSSQEVQRYVDPNRQGFECEAHVVRQSGYH